MIASASFLKSAASADDFPRTGLAEIAMVGRSNVGKSTLINAVTGLKVARTSAAPGKTRLANYYAVESRMPNPESRQVDHVQFYLVDLPGYGYARGGADSAEEFEALTRQYFDPSQRHRRHIGGVLHLIDARHPDLPQDAAAHDWIVRTRVDVAVVATKMDKLKQSEQSRSIKTLSSKYQGIIMPVSAVKGAGIEDIRRLLHRWAQLGV